MAALAVLWKEEKEEEEEEDSGGGGNGGGKRRITWQYMAIPRPVCMSGVVFMRLHQVGVRIRSRACDTVLRERGGEVQHGDCGVKPGLACDRSACGTRTWPLTSAAGRCGSCSDPGRPPAWPSAQPGQSGCIVQGICYATHARTHARSPPRTRAEAPTTPPHQRPAVPWQLQTDFWAGVSPP